MHWIRWSRLGKGTEAYPIGGESARMGGPGSEGSASPPLRAARMGPKVPSSHQIGCGRYRRYRPPPIRMDDRPLVGTYGTVPIGNRVVPIGNHVVPSGDGSRTRPGLGELHRSDQPRLLGARPLFLRLTGS